MVFGKHSYIGQSRLVSTGLPIKLTMALKLSYLPPETTELALLFTI
jgi:hypothetical protein